MAQRARCGWEEVEEQFRSDWERRYPNIPWNEVRLGYRYGWEQAHQPGYREREWPGVERDLQARWREWEARYAAGSDQSNQLIQTWDDLRGSVRYGWDQARTAAGRSA